jgi:hypothetical protein
LRDDASSATRHCAQRALIYFDVTADPTQSDSGAQTGNRPARHDNLEHLAPQKRWPRNHLGWAIAHMRTYLRHDLNSRREIRSLLQPGARRRREHQRRRAARPLVSLHSYSSVVSVGGRDLPGNRHCVAIVNSSIGVDARNWRTHIWSRRPLSSAYRSFIGPFLKGR